MDFSVLNDFANDAALSIAKYTVEFTLSPDLLNRDDFVVPDLDWQFIPYGRDEIERVPDDQRGVYAFTINIGGDALPPHGYILYIGIAGRNSDRPLRARYKDYLNLKGVAKRKRIARMIDTWRTDLRFYFAPVDNTVSSADLLKLEEQLNTALLPPFSEGDIEAEVKSQRRAYR